MPFTFLGEIFVASGVCHWLCQCFSDKFDAQLPNTRSLHSQSQWHTRKKATALRVASHAKPDPPAYPLS